MSLVRSEALHEDGDMRKVVERSYKDMCRDTLEDLTPCAAQGAATLPALDELVAFALLGGVENIVMRASWDDQLLHQGRPLDGALRLSGGRGRLHRHAGSLGRPDQVRRTIGRLAASPPPVPPDARP